MKRVSNSFREDEIRGALSLLAILDRDPTRRVIMRSDGIVSLRKKLLTMRARIDAAADPPDVVRT